MPFVVLGQTYHERALEILPSTPLEIIHIEENGTDIKAFIVEKKMVEAGKWANQEEPLYPINLFHVVDMNAEGTKNIESYVLDQFIFPKNQNITFRKGRVTYGESSTIRTYAELIEMYPQLSQVKRIDFENRVMPGAYYKGDLRTGSLNDKIKGFRVTQLTKAAANSTAASKPKAKKKKKGLMGKVGGAINTANSLGNKNAGRTPTYGVADEVDLNWENSYNGGQDKKNHWKCKMSALCPTTGNLLAFNVYQKKGEDLSQAQTQEVILFSPKGEIISKHDLNNDIPWELKDKVAHYSDTEDGGKKLEHASLIFTQVTGKKYKEGKDNMLRVLTINNSGEIVYDHTYELENRIGTIFNSTTSDGHKVIINNHYHKNLAYFIVESSPSGQAQATITTEKKEKRLEFEAYILSE